MLDVATIPDEPPRELRFRRSAGLVGSLTELWGRRELVATLAMRDFIARYKQTFLGVGWSIVQPLALVLAMSLFLHRFTRADTEGVPYPVWTMVGLIPWSFFSGALSGGVSSLLSNQPLLNKVRCPREAFPFAAVALTAVDTAISVATLGVLFAATGFAPAATVYWVPLLVLVQLPAAFGAAALTAIVVVYLRDLRSILPLVLQLGLFVTPIAFALSQIPQRWRALYCLVNPVAGIIDSYRRVVLYGKPPQAEPLLLSAVSGLVIFVIGMRLFKRLEVGIADLI